MTAQERLKALLAEYVAPLMKRHGYTRKGTRWGKRAPGLGDEGWLIYHVQSSVRSTSDRVDFTANVGVFSAALYDALGRGIPRASLPAEADCQYRERIGFLMPCACDLWWHLDLSGDAARVGSEVRTVTEELALPHLEHGATPEGLLRLFERPTDSPAWMAHAAMILLVHGAEASRLWLDRRLDIDAGRKRIWFDRLDQLARP